MASLAETQAQETRPRTEVSEQESLQLTRNLLRIAMSNISYVRGLFPENFYCEKFVPALEMKVNKLLPMDMESRRFIDWTEKGVFDALQKKYLRTLFLTICRGQDGPPLEEYSFSFKYAAKGAFDNITSMTIESSTGGPVITETSNQMSPLQMKQSACKMVCTLVQLMYALDDVPKERAIVMRLHYYDDITPEDYEPPLFVSSTDEDPNPWDHEPLKMQVGHVDGRHYKLAIKVKSVLDPFDDLHDLAENGTCSSDLMLTSDDSSTTSSETVALNAPSSQLCGPPSRPCQPIQKVLPQMETPIQASEYKEQIQGSIIDKIEHPLFEAGNLRRSGRLQKREEVEVDTIDITDCSQLSKVEPGCKDHQRKEGRWSNDTRQYAELELGCPATDKANIISEADKYEGPAVADNVKQIHYEKALLHTLPREHITMKKLQQVLVGVSPSYVKKVMSQMCRDGYVETTPKARWKGRQVFHNPDADKKLQSLRAFFDSEMKGKGETKQINKCDDRELSQPCGGRVRRSRIRSIVPNIEKKEQSETLDDLVRGREQALDSDVTRQGLKFHPSANDRHSKPIPSPLESSLSEKAMPALGLQKQVAQRKDLTKGLKHDIKSLEATEIMVAENLALTSGPLREDLDAKNEERKRLRAWTFAEELELSEDIEDRAERSKASILSEQPHVTVPKLGFKRRRVRFHDSDSLEDIYVDCTLHLKARKADGPVDGAIHLSPFERARAERLVSAAHKGNHLSQPGNDPYHFDTEGPGKSRKKKFRGNTVQHHASVNSLKRLRKTDANDNFDSISKSEALAETLNSREKTRFSFLQRGTALKKCPRPVVYVRKPRAA